MIRREGGLPQPRATAGVCPGDAQPGRGSGGSEEVLVQKEEHQSSGLTLN